MDFLQIEANGTVEPDVVLATVANYQNNSGYSYYRLLGFKPICRWGDRAGYEGM